MAHILNAGNQQHCRHEYLAALSSMCVPIPTQYYEGAVGDEAVNVLLSHYDYSPTPWITIDSNWKLTWILPVFLARYPESRVVHLVRDPRLNVTACHNLDFYGTLRFLDEFRARDFWLRWMPNVDLTGWSEFSPFEKNCAFWTETHRITARALAEHDWSLRIRLEDLGTDDALRRVYDFFDLPRPSRRDRVGASRARVNERNEVKRQILARKADALAPYEEWSPERRHRLAELCGETAAGFGYDL